MVISKNISLKSYNTFGIDVCAAYFTIVTNNDELEEALTAARRNNIPAMVLGGGSNVLFTKNVEGMVIKNAMPGINTIKETADHVYVKAGAGVAWHEFVQYCLQQGLAGVENLALIPGSVGASPLQNIGAYGVEIKDVFEDLTALHRFDLGTKKFSAAECAFGYRESVFKNKYKDQFVITDVTYRLNKVPKFNIGYGAIRQELEQKNIQQLSIGAIADAVISIRSAKLPDPKKLGNAGSFFKNPSVSATEFSRLKNKYPNIVAYPNADGTVKLAAGWLIEECGLKGLRRGNAGIHQKQALVLINYGGASGKDILQLCHSVRESVQEKFGIALAPEVNIV